MGASLMSALELASEELQERVQGALARTPAEEPAQVAASTLLDFAASRPEQAHLLARCSLCEGQSAREQRQRLIDSLVCSVEHGWEQRGEAPGPDVPALAIVGGLLRWLALRPRGPDGILGAGATELDQLRAVTRMWIESYWADGPPFEWRRATSPERMRWIDSIPLPSTLPVELPAAGLELEECALIQRERILQATAHLAFQLGYAGVTVEAVLALAEVSREEFDSHFADLQSAAEAAAERAYELTMSTAARVFFGPGSWAERLCRAGLAMQEDFRSHPALMHLTFVELHAVGQSSFTLARDRLFAYTLMLEEGFSQSPAALAFPRGGAEAIACALMELCYVAGSQMHSPRQPDLNAVRCYMAIAPFIGVRAAGDLLAAEVPAASV